MKYCEKQHGQNDMSPEELRKQNMQKKYFGKKRKYLAVICFLIVAAFVVSIFYILQQEPDKISEEVVRKLVSVQLNKNPKDLTNEDFAKITEFTIYGFKVYRDSSKVSFQRSGNKLSVIFYARQYGTPYSMSFDLPVYTAFMSKLGFNNKNEKYFFDLNALKKIPNLRSLNVRSTDITNIKSLRKLNHLESLTVIYTRISNPDQFRGLKELHALEFQYISLDNIEPLSKSTKLSSINISNNKVSSIEPLRKLKNLQYLHLENNPVTNIEPLTGMVKITSLFLDNTSISDLSPLKSLPDMAILSLKKCKNIQNDQVVELQEALPNLKIVR